MKEYLDPIETMLMTTSPAYEGISDGIRRLFARLKKDSITTSTSSGQKPTGASGNSEAEIAALAAKWPFETRVEIVKVAIAEAKKVLNSFPKEAAGVFTAEWISGEYFDEDYEKFTTRNEPSRIHLEIAKFKPTLVFDIDIISFDIEPLAAAFGIGSRQVFDHVEANKLMCTCFEAICNISKPLQAKFGPNIVVEYGGDWDDGPFGINCF